MPIFKLKQENNSIENAVLIPASKTSLALEKHLEGWNTQVIQNPSNYPSFSP